MFGLEINVIAAYIFGLILLYIIGRVFLKPLKFILKLIYNALLGGILLLLVNLPIGFLGIHIGINPITALVAGLLGVPGVIFLTILQMLK
jgi:inhibitor of the pro-sigma K processing machinery